MTRKTTAQQRVRVLAMGMTTLALAACAQTLTTHGQVIREAQLAELTIGHTTRDEVMVSLGTPSSRALFDDNKWIYVTTLTKSEALRPNQLQERTVVTLTFDDTGILQNMDVRNQDDGRPVAISRRTTPTQGQSLGIIDQLLDNLGRGF